MRRLEDFGHVKMTEELAKLDTVNQLAEKKCQVEFVAKAKLPKSDRPFGAGVLGYKVNGIKKHPECEWMAIQEPKFIDYMRNLQRNRAENSLGGL